MGRLVTPLRNVPALAFFFTPARFCHDGGRYAGVLGACLLSLRQLDLIAVGVSQICRAAPVVILWRRFERQASLDEFATGSVYVVHGERDVVVGRQVIFSGRVGVVDQDLYRTEDEDGHIFGLGDWLQAQQMPVEGSHFRDVGGEVGEFGQIHALENLRYCLISQPLAAIIALFVVLSGNARVSRPDSFQKGSRSGVG